MRVIDMLIDLKKKFPRSPIDGWENTYRMALGRHEGEALRAAYDATMAAWTEAGVPKPAHIAEHLPKPDKPLEGARVGADRDLRRRARFNELVDDWRRRLHQWFEAADAEGWGYHLRQHVLRLAAEVAAGEIEFGRDHAAALAWANARDKRAGHPHRAPDDIVDHADAAIFRARAASQDRIKGRKVADDGGFAARAERMRRRIFEAAEGRASIPDEARAEA